MLGFVLGIAMTVSKFKFFNSDKICNFKAVNTLYDICINLLASALWAGGIFLIAILKKTFIPVF